MKQLAARYHRPIPIVTRQVQQALIAYDWPGNVRELRNTVEGMLVLDKDGKLDVDDLPTIIAPVGLGSEGSEVKIIGARCWVCL